jgi:hypothetical protein
LPISNFFAPSCCIKNIFGEQRGANDKEQRGSEA